MGFNCHTECIGSSETIIHGTCGQCITFVEIWTKIGLAPMGVAKDKVTSTQNFSLKKSTLFLPGVLHR